MRNVGGLREPPNEWQRSDLVRLQNLGLDFRGFRGFRGLGLEVSRKGDCPLQAVWVVSCSACTGGAALMRAALNIRVTRARMWPLSPASHAGQRLRQKMLPAARLFRMVVVATLEQGKK